MTKPFLVISMEKILLFIFVAFGDFRNQVEPFSSSWECPTLGQEQPGFFFFFSVPFLHLTLVKVLNITTDLAVSGETIKDKQTILSKTSFGLGILHIPTPQVTINYMINTASSAAHGAQDAKITLLKPLVEILLPMVSQLQIRSLIQKVPRGL